MSSFLFKFELEHYGTCYICKEKKYVPILRLVEVSSPRKGSGTQIAKSQITNSQITKIGSANSQVPRLGSTTSLTIY